MKFENLIPENLTSQLDEVMLNEVSALDIQGLCCDTRKIQKGDLFFGLAGVKVDGMAFAKQAQDAGACAILTHQGVDASGLSIPVIEVAEPRFWLAKLAAKFYRTQPEKIVAVTGTAGKTSVATFVRQIWEYAGLRAANIGTTGVFAPNRADYGTLTTPDPIALQQVLKELAEDKVSHTAMEASSHGLDQYRLDGVELCAGGFTNLGRDHLDYHPTVEDYLNAKMRLFEDLLKADQPAIIFADDVFSDEVIRRAKTQGLKVLTVGRNGDYIKIKRTEQGQFGQVAELEIDGELHLIKFPLAGDFQLFNGLVAAGLAIVSGVEAGVAINALEHLSGASGRLELIGKASCGAPAYVDYAHKPEAMENVLEALRPFTTGRLIVVFGCGGDRDPGKRPIMGEIASRLADHVIVTDDNPRTEDAGSVRREILQAVPEAEEIGDRREAILHGVNMLNTGDCIVVIGKGHEEGQIVGDKILPFSDHAVLRDALGIQEN
jgi:UDP-N-acetylmuramoyl-L-alanyl-D-glutamate--2,6-diaminopimelate ligase